MYSIRGASASGKLHQAAGCNCGDTDDRTAKALEVGCTTLINHNCTEGIYIYTVNLTWRDVYKCLHFNYTAATNAPSTTPVRNHMVVLTLMYFVMRHTVDDWQHRRIDAFIRTCAAIRWEWWLYCNDDSRYLYRPLL